MLALWVAGTLGLVHRSAHVSDGAHAAAAHSATRGDVHDAADWVAALFGQHQDADCRLYDHLAHGPAALGVAMIVLPPVLPVAMFDFLEGLALARWVALFDARGPPATL